MTNLMGTLGRFLFLVFIFHPVFIGQNLLSKYVRRTIQKQHQSHWIVQYNKQYHLLVFQACLLYFNILKDYHLVYPVWSPKLTICQV